MRALLVVSLVALFAPTAAIAQSSAPPAPSTAPAAPSPPPATPSAAPAKGADITKEQYIDRAVERARRAAEKRFDRMDANHDGVLSAEERRASRAQRRAAPSE